MCKSSRRDARWGTWPTESRSRCRSHSPATHITGPARLEEVTNDCRIVLTWIKYGEQLGSAEPSRTVEDRPTLRRSVFRAPLNLFRTLAIAEAVSWTLLITGMILRRTLDLPIAVTIGGGIHGFVFLAYAATAIVVAKNQRWSPGIAALAIGSAVIPYATIPTEIYLHRTGRLAGAWRLTATQEPRDHTWHDRLMRTALNRPLVLAGVLAIAVVGLYVLLLIVGPPGGSK